MKVKMSWKARTEKRILSYKGKELIKKIRRKSKKENKREEKHTN